MKPRARFCLLTAALLTSISTPAQQWDWVQRFQGDGTTGTAVGVDAAQNVYVAGTFTGTNYFGTHRITSAAGENLFIAKFDSSGVPLWTTLASGALAKMLVASNGSIFVCGHLTFHEPATAQSFSNVFLARLDDGVVTWTEPLPEGVTLGSSMTFGPDETIHVLGATNQAFVQRYTQGGFLIDGFAVQFRSVTPVGIAVGPEGQVFVAARFETNGYDYDFTARLSASGELAWRWTLPGTDFRWVQQVQAITATRDGGVVSVGYHSTDLPDRAAFVVKHSGDGVQAWRTGAAGYFKRFYSAEAVTVDMRGNIYVTGYADGSYYNRERLLVLTLSPTGERLSNEQISSYIAGDANTGTAIAVDKDGAVFVTGRLKGQTIFGTNRLSHAPANGFVARRSTILPELVQEQVGNNLALSWPTTALPFALQQSADGGINWSFVPSAPQRDGWHNRVLLSANHAAMMYRLLRTNELPILHLPRIFPISAPGVAFLDHTNVIIAGSERPTTFRLWCSYDDEDENWLTVSWTNVQTGEALTNDVSVSSYPGRNDSTYHHPPYYWASVAVDTSMFPPGRHSDFVTVSVSDGTFTMTQTYPEFEVIGMETALAEFMAALEPLRLDRMGQKAVTFVEAALRAADKGREKLAERRWKIFQRQIQRVTSVSEHDRRRLSSAAAQIQSLQ